MNGKILQPMTQEQVVIEAQQMQMRMLRLNTAAMLMSSMIDGLANGEEFVEKADKATKAADALLKRHGFTISEIKRNVN